MSLRSDAQSIISASIRAVQPDAAVQRALRGREFPGRVVLAAAGKAAWQMAKAARDCLGDRISAGMEGERKLAESLGIPVRQIQAEEIQSMGFSPTQGMVMG